MEWINVKDRLPILEESTFKDYDSVEIITFDGQTVEHDEFCAGRMPEFWSSFKRVDITHWMPLPEPPQ